MKIQASPIQITLLSMLAAGIVLWAGFCSLVLTGADRYAFLSETKLPITTWEAWESESKLTSEGLAIKQDEPRGITTVGTSLAVPVEASSVKQIEVKFSPLFRFPDLQFGWIRTDSPDVTWTYAMLPDESGTAILNTSWLPEWSGHVESLVIIRLGSPNLTPVLQSVSMIHDKPTFGQLQARLFGDWLDWRDWTQLNINRVLVGDGNPLVSPTLAVALWLALSFIFFLIWRVFNPGAALLPALIMVIATGWVVLDLRWQGDLLYKLNETRKQFAGKSWHEKRKSEIDGPEFQFMLQLKLLIDDPEKRVLILSSSQFHHYRARYHVLPHPAYSRNLPPTRMMISQFRPGDHVVLLDEDVMSPRGAVRPISDKPYKDIPIQLKLDDASGRNASVTKVNAQTTLVLEVEDGQLLRTAPYPMFQPGFYKMMVYLSSKAHGSVARLTAHSITHAGERLLLAERRVKVDQESIQEFSLPFFIPEQTRVEWRVFGEGAIGLMVEGIHIDLMPEQEHLELLASGGDSPYLVVRPVLSSEVAAAFEVL